MGMNANKEIRKSYPALNGLSIEELQNLLQQDFNSSNDMDMNYITAILEVIKRKEKENEEALVFDAEKSWNVFEEKYMTMESKNAHTHQANIKHRKRNLWQILAAAIVVALSCGALTAQAFGYNIFRFVAQWTDEVFTFRSAIEETVPPSEMEELPADKQYDSIIDVLYDLNIATKVVPSWYPDGFSQTHLLVSQQHPERTMIDAVFESENRLFSISITIYNEMSEDLLGYYMKDENPVYEHDFWGITHYIMSNNSRMSAIWINEKVEVSIQGDITEDELIQMINSIYR